MLRFNTEEDFLAFQKDRKVKVAGAAAAPEMKLPKAFRDDNKKASPHAVAMAYLASHPDAFEGDQEHYEQCRIFYEIERHHPEIYESLYAVPNGGKRSKATAGRMKAEGQKKGELDINLDTPRGVYHGLRLELKWGKNKATKEQISTCERHLRNGYLAVVVWGADDAIKLILAYDALEAGEELEIA